MGKCSCTPLVLENGHIVHKINCSAMTRPSNTELRKAIKQILQPLAASVASKTLGIDGRRAYRLKAERELVALFQAREQQLLNELLGELPDKRLKRNGEPTTNMATAEWGFNQAIDQVVSVIERYREGLHE